MADRLQELLHQKALLNEQAAWLEREIIAEQARIGAFPEPAPKASEETPPDGPSPDASTSPAAVDANANAILEQYRSNSRSLQQEVRRGCFLYFFGALALLGLVIAVIYLTHHGK
jgi:hypothetical protein